MKGLSKIISRIEKRLTKLKSIVVKKEAEIPPSAVGGAPPEEPGVKIEHEKQASPEGNE